MALYAIGDLHLSLKTINQWMYSMAKIIGGVNMLEKAILIATNAHQGQIDEAGEIYILHPLRLMFSRINETERICAVLHDVIEDTDITLDYLKNEGFSEEILSALDALTRRRNESYGQFISRIINNKIACYVKLADLSDNMDLSRIKNPTEKDFQRIEKYRKAAKKILGALEEEGDREFIKSKEIEINGCASVPESCSKESIIILKLIDELTKIVRNGPLCDEDDMTMLFRAAIIIEDIKKLIKGNPVARYDKSRQTYLLYADGRREYY